MFPFIKRMLFGEEKEETRKSKKEVYVDKMVLVDDPRIVEILAKINYCREASGRQPFTCYYDPETSMYLEGSGYRDRRNNTVWIHGEWYKNIKSLLVFYNELYKDWCTDSI